MIRPSSLALILCCFMTSCNDSEKDSDKRKLSKMEQKIADLKNEIEGLELEQEKLVAITEQSLKQIKIFEQKRLAAERAEQVRIKADTLELRGLYASKLKSIKLRQEFAWEGYVGKTYDTLKATNGQTFQNAKVVAVNADGMSVQHTNGVTRIPFSLLGPDVIKQCVTTFDEQREQLEKWQISEANERAYIREQAKKKAEKEFEKK